MSAGQTIEPHAGEMEPAKQIQATETRIDQNLLGLVDFEKREGSAAAREPVTHESDRSLGTWQHLPINPADLGGQQRLFGGKSIDFAAPLQPQHGHLRLYRRLFRARTIDIAPIGCPVSERDRPANHDREIIALPKVPQADPTGRIADIARFGKANPSLRGLSFCQEQSNVRRFSRIARKSHVGKNANFQLEIGIPPPPGGQICASDFRLSARLIARDPRFRDSSPRSFACEERIESTPDAPIDFARRSLRGGQTLIRNPDCSLRGKRFDPGRLDLGKPVKHSQTGALRRYTGFRARRIDARFPLSGALPCALVPGGCLGCLKWRILAGAGKILEFHSDGVTRSHISLCNCCLCDVHVRSIRRKNWITAGDTGKRLTQRQGLSNCRLSYENEREQAMERPYSKGACARTRTIKGKHDLMPCI
jgi:hypothetical protein